MRTILILALILWTLVLVACFYPTRHNPPDAERIQEQLNNPPKPPAS